MALLVNPMYDRLKRYSEFINSSNDNLKETLYEVCTVDPFTPKLTTIN